MWEVWLCFLAKVEPHVREFLWYYTEVNARDEDCQRSLQASPPSFVALASIGAETHHRTIRKPLQTEDCGCLKESDVHHVIS